MISQASVQLEKITIYPIKSLTGIPLNHTEITEHGSLKNDRRWALFDKDQKVFNAKRSELLHQIDFEMPSPEHWSLKFKNEQTSTEMFEFQKDMKKIESWFSDHLKTKLKIKENTEHGFPDDLEAKGPTLVSLQSLKTVCSWFSELSVEECQNRFRANLMIQAPQPFWEDRLVGKKGQTLLFQLGNIEFQGLKICQRCIVPTRSTQNGSISPDFIKTFKANRESSLPNWSERSRFDHFYRLAINTQISPNQTGQSLRIGDSLKFD